MKRRFRALGSALLVSISIVGSGNSSSLAAQEPPAKATQPVDSAPDAAAAAETPDESKERVTAERFLELLKKRPRQGTALDKVYGYHVGRGSLDQFAAALETEAQQKNDGNLWLVLGMVQMQRGQDALAAGSLEKAEALLPQEPLTSFYLGKTLVLLGEVDKAAAALRRAIERKPPKADLLAIFQNLGRIYQRTGRVQEALDVWKQLESLFPGDEQVREQIAGILAEEGANEAALERYLALAAATKDRNRKVELTIRAAQLKGLLGKTDEALATFEQQLSTINPDSWLHRDIRRRIEEIFRATNDVDGLVAYYTKWIEKHPDDVDAMMRAARVLAAQKRLPEAEKWFRDAITKAPSLAEPRLALVESLAMESRYDQAATEMGKLVELEPDNPDYIVRWGELVYGDKQRGEEQRRAEAGDIWRRMLKKRGDDPVTVSRVADLLRSSGAADAAIEQYKAAIALAPNEPQYREYLGEYLHQLNRRDEALATWRELAAGSRETRDNLVRLSEVLSTFHYDAEAISTIAKACDMKPSFGHRARYAELLREAQRYDEALQQLDLAEPLAEDPELREVVMDERIKNYQASGQLEKRIAAAEEAVAGDKAQDASAWRMLALLRDADRKFQPACDAIDKATELAPGDVTIWETAAQLQERTGKIGEAIAAYRKLATLDRRFLSNYLTQIASLEMRLGNTEAAIKAGEELLAAAPGNSEHYRFYADLCFRAGQTARALDALRRNVRSNPNDQEAMLHLAKMLAEDFHTDEAIELYWRAFDLGKDLDAKVTAIAALAELYLRVNRFESLTERLELLGREQNKPRDGLLWVAAAHQAAGDLGMAKRLLEQLAREDSRDTKLLEQLVSLSRAEFDFESAAEYQKRLVAAAPTPEAEYALANLLLELGQVDEAESLWLKLSQRQDDSKALTASINTLFAKEQFQTAATLIEKALSLNPNDWELAAPAMLIYVKLKRNDDAQKVADRVLAMKVDPRQPTKDVQEQIKKQAARQSNQPFRYDPFANLGDHSRLLQLAAQFKQLLVGSESQSARMYISGMASSTRAMGSVLCFQDVQALARCVPLALADDKFDLDGFIKEQVDKAIASRDVEQIWSALFYLPWQDPQVTNAQRKNESYDRCVDMLVELDDPTAAGLKLSQLVNQRAQRNAQQNNTFQPLSPDEITQFRRLSELSMKQNIGNLGYYGLWFAIELAFSGHPDDANKLIDEYIARSLKTPNGNQAALQAMSLMLSERANQPTPEPMVNKALELFRATLPELKLNPAGTAVYYGQQFGALLSRLVALKRFPESVQLLDEILIWQAKQTAEMRPAQRSRLATSKDPLSYGKVVNGRHVVTTIAYPPASAFYGGEAIMSLNALYEACKDDPAQLGELEKTVYARSSETSDDVYLKFARCLAASGLAYWTGNLQQAEDLLVQADALQIEPQLIGQGRARLLYEAGKTREALAIVEQIRPTHQQMMVDRELTILQLVLQLGDLERAKQSSQRLFALRLDPDTEFKLADLMQQLGMKDLATRTMDRIRRRTGGRPDTLADLMRRYASSDEKEAAAEIARQIIRRTSPRGSQNYYTSENQQHESAVRVLAQVGMLDPLITQYEELVKRSPKSAKLVDKLYAFYEAAGRRADAEKLRMAAVENAPDDPRGLYAAGQQLLRLNKHAEAADKFAAAVAKSPDLLDQNYYNMQNAFEQSKTWPKLADAIIKAGMKRFAQSYHVGQLCSELNQAKEFDTLNRLLCAILEEADWGNLYYINDWSASSDFKPDAKLIAIVGEKLTKPEARFDNLSNQSLFVSSRSSNGQTFGFINLLAGIVIADRPLADKVLAAMDARLAKNANEAFPRILNCYLLVQLDQFKKFDEMVQPLLDKKEKDPAELHAIFGLASLAMHGLKKPDLTCRLLEAADTAQIDKNDSSEFQYSSTSLLAYAYERAKRPADAHRILSKVVRTAVIDESQSQYNPGYGEYQFIQSMAELSERLLKMHYAAEAFIAYRKAFGDPALLEKANRWGGDFTHRKETLGKAVAKARTPDTILGIFKATLDPTGADEPTRLAAEFLTQPQIERKSLIDHRISFALEQFAGDLADQTELRQAISKWLQESPLPADASQLPLKTLVTRLLISEAAGDKEQIAAAAAAIGGWTQVHAPPAPPTPEPAAEAAKTPATSSVSGAISAVAQQGALFTISAGTNRPRYSLAEAKPLPEELLLGMAALIIPADAAQANEVMAMLDRAIVAAKGINETGLVTSLQCQIARRLAPTEPDRARSIFNEALNELLPPADQQAAAPVKESK